MTHVRGIDISENMVQKYNDAADSSSLSTEQVNAVVGDLLADEVPEHLNTPEYYDFDVAVIGLGFHHFDNPVRAVQRLNERLKPGVGVLLIIDFLPFNEEQGPSSQDLQHTIKHSGFEQKNIETIFKIARFERFSFSVIDEPAIMNMQDGPRKRQMFVARGVKEPGILGKIGNWITGMQNSAQSWQPIQYRETPKKLGVFGESHGKTGI